MIVSSSSCVSTSPPRLESGVLHLAELPVRPPARDRKTWVTHGNPGTPKNKMMVKSKINGGCYIKYYKMLVNYRYSI